MLSVHQELIIWIRQFTKTGRHQGNAKISKEKAKVRSGKQVRVRGLAGMS